MFVSRYVSRFSVASGPPLCAPMLTTGAEGRQCSVLGVQCPQPIGPSESFAQGRQGEKRESQLGTRRSSACSQRNSVELKTLAGVPAATMSGTDDSKLHPNSHRYSASFDLARSSPRGTTRKSQSATFDLGSDEILSLSRHFSDSAGRSPKPPSSSSPSGSGSPRVRQMTWGQNPPSKASPRSAGSPASATRGSSKNLVESLRAEVSQAEEMEKLR
jgi:hypothetical protein